MVARNEIKLRFENRLRDVSYRVQARRRIAAFGPLDGGALFQCRGFPKSIEDLAEAADKDAVAIKPCFSFLAVETEYLDAWAK